MLVALIILFASSVQLVLHVRIDAVANEVRILEREAIARADKLREDQKLAMLDAEVRARLAFMNQIENHQRSISETLGHLLSWLPDDVALSSISMEGTGTVSLFGSGTHLTSIARLLQNLSGDEAYTLLSMSPLTNQGTGYAFNMVLLSIAAENRGEEIDAEVTAP